MKIEREKDNKFDSVTGKIRGNKITRRFDEANLALAFGFVASIQMKILPIWLWPELGFQSFWTPYEDLQIQ